MSATAAKKRISALDEDDLLLEDVTPVKKARSDGDNTFEDEELDEDALLGLSDNEEQYEVDGVSDYQENVFSTEPELDEDGGYNVYPEESDLGKHDYGEQQQFDHEESEQDYTTQEGLADEEYSEDTTETYEEGFEHTGDVKETESEEYKGEPTVDTTGDPGFLDVLDIDITDDSLIKELEEEEEVVKSSPSGPFVKPLEPPRKFSTPKVTSQTTPLKPSSGSTPTQRKEEQIRKTVQKTEVAEIEPITSKETTSAEDDEEEDDEEEKETRGGRFRSERKEIVSLKSGGSRNRNIPDTLELSEASKKELEEYERQHQEEKQKKMQRKQGRRGGRGGPGWGRGGPGGPGGHFHQRGRGFRNQRGMMPFPGPRAFGNRPMYFPRNPMRGFPERQRFNPPPLIPIIPLQVQQPLITLTDASFTEDEMVHSFGSDDSPRDSPPPRHHAPPPPVVSQQQRPQGRPPESRSPGKPVIHVNPHFKGQRPQLPNQTPHDVNTARPVGHVPHTTVQAIPSIHEAYRRSQGEWHERPQSSPVSSQGHHLQSHGMEELPPPGSSNSQRWRETPPNEPIYAQSRMGGQNLQSEMHRAPTSSAPSNQHFQHHPPEAPRDDAQSHLGPSNERHPSSHRSDHHQGYLQDHHKHHREPHPHHHHPHHPHDHHHPQDQDTTHPMQEGFVAPRVANPQLSENFGGTRRQHRMETPHRQDQSNQADQWQRNQGLRPQRPGPVRMPPPIRPQGQQQQPQPGGERLAPPPQAMIEEASRHHQTEETTVTPAGMDSSEENDPETKKLRMQIEEQKKLREAIVKRKEERRQQLAAKKQMELKNRIAMQKQNQESQSEQQPSQQNLNAQQQNQQQNMNKQQQRQQPQGTMNRQQPQQQGMNKQFPVQKRQQIMQKQPSQPHQSLQQGSNPGAKVMGQSSNHMQQRRNSAGQAIQMVQGTPQGQGFQMEQHHEITAGHPIPTLGGGGGRGRGEDAGSSTGPAHSFEAGNRRPFHKRGGPQNIANVGRGQLQQDPIQHDHYQRGRGGFRGPLRGQSRGQVRGRPRGAMGQQQQRQVVSHQPSNFESAEHQVVHQHPQFPRPQGPHGSGPTPPQRQHHPPHQQQPQHNTQQQHHHQQQQRGRGQIGKVSVKQRLGRGAGGVQQHPQGFQQQQQQQHQQRGGMQLKRGRGHGNFQGGRNPNAPQNLRHPHPGGGDAPLLNPQCGISIEGLDHGTDGNLVMRMMVSVGPVQALKMYPMHRKAIGFFINPNHAVAFQQMYNGSVVGFSQVHVKLLGGRPVT